MLAGPGRVVECFGDRAALRHLLPPPKYPAIQAIDDRLGFILAQLPSLFGEQLSPFAFRLVQ